MMNEMLKIHIGKQNTDFAKVQSGQIILLTGEMITLRDLSLMKLHEIYSNNKLMPINLSGAVIFFAGPTDGFDENKGSIGPTTASRMEKFFPMLAALGVKAIIGKGDLSSDAIKILKENSMIYLQAFGGAGAYYGKKVLSIETLLFPELGPEAVFKLNVEDMPAVIIIDELDG